jgi:hypothetical protein
MNVGELFKVYACKAEVTTPTKQNHNQSEIVDAQGGHGIKD